jgi:hypothetical protein
MLPLLVVLLILSALTTTVSFVLYLKARTAERDHPDAERPNPERMALLDRTEKRYQRIHFISLCLFVIIGVAILSVLSHRIP